MVKCGHGRRAGKRLETEHCRTTREWHESKNASVRCSSDDPTRRFGCGYFIDIVDASDSSYHPDAACPTDPCHSDTQFTNR
ncbi:unnamed protein product [Onchocerca flexuosa]|uniref:Uncharacterized protein n=1 Tax=Onchocerca flexuosa TaxID=387005 RepID=A0A183HAC6_9BILA|nr:unnamed protein product [Onchocerca flexuosa]